MMASLRHWLLSCYHGEPDYLRIEVEHRLAMLNAVLDVQLRENRAEQHAQTRPTRQQVERNRQ